MNTKKIFGYGALSLMSVITVMITLAFAAMTLAGCGDPEDGITGGTNQTPVAGDFTVSGTGTFTFDGTAKTVTVTAKAGKTAGAVTVKYDGNGNAPSAVGTYPVTFDVAAAAGWNATSGLAAGTLTISPASGNDITYTVQADGADNTTTSTEITFTFSASVDSLGLTVGDITVGGTAEKGTATLSGTGTTRTLSPITVTNAGQATVSIAKTGIEAETKHVTVYKAGETAPALTGITAVYSGGNVEINSSLDSLKTDLTVTAQYTSGGDSTLSANEYTLSVSIGTDLTTVGEKTITVSYEGETDDFTVTVVDSAGDTSAPVLSAGSVNRTSDTTATVGFTADEAGTAYYLVYNSGQTPAPANTAVKAGTSLGAAASGANTGKAVTLTAGAKDIYVVVEDAAGNISEPLKIEAEAYVAGDTTAPVLSAGSVNRTGDTAATIGFTADEAGTAYYLVYNSGQTPAPANTAVKAGTSLGAAASGANTGMAVTLTAGAKDIYVAVEDAAGNISEPLKIEAAAYVPPSLQAGFYDKANPTGGDTPINIDGQTGANIAAKAVAYINADTSGAAEYTLVLGENVANVAAITHNKNGVTLTITSVDATERVISKGTAANGQVFFIGGTSSAPSSAKLVIDGTVTLQGKSGNNRAVINVEYGGSLELKGNAKITGNTSNGNGSGISTYGDADNRATVIMSGNAEISGNTMTGYRGGGVYLSSYSDLTMNGNAAIKNNSLTNGTTSQGGGVCIYSTNSTTFTMNGGEISGNSVTHSGVNAALGGGVYIYSNVNCQFIVASEAVKLNIKNNTVTNTGTGTATGAQVYKDTNGVFTVGGVAQGTSGTAQGWDSWD